MIIDQDFWTGHLKDQGLDCELANKILGDHISLMMNIILNEDEERIYSYYSDLINEEEKPDQSLKDEFKTKLKARLDSVRSILNDKIKRKFLLRVTTKENIPKLVDWEIRSKLHDARRGHIGIPSYVCLRIEYLKASPDRSAGFGAEETWKFFGTLNSLREVATFELDADDLGEIIETLENAKSKLLSAEGQQ